MAADLSAAPLALPVQHLWWPDPDEQERYWKHIDVIRTWPEEEQKHFMNGGWEATLAGTQGRRLHACTTAS